MRPIHRELFELRFDDENMKPKPRPKIEEVVKLGYNPLAPPIDENYELKLYHEVVDAETAETGFAPRGNVLDRK